MTDEFGSAVWSLMARATRVLSLAALTLGLLASGASAQNSTDGPMFFHSYVKDAKGCAMTVESNGEIVFPEGISNPAATCPDAFGWKQFIDAVSSQFWVNWANDETVWASQPKPVCTRAGQNDCCFVDISSNIPQQVGYRNAEGVVVKPDDIGGPGKYCPYIPADWGGSDETTFAGGKPVTSHNTTFLRLLDPARIARQREVEVVYRNDPFVRYTTAQELYSQAGLKKLFDKMAGQAANSSPYRPHAQGVSYPPDAVMFKVDWIPEATMVELGYVKNHDNDPKTPPQNPDYPYITMKISASTDNGKTYKEGIYYLAAVTGASKALPNWHWYAFEHVANLGRCDYLGCNDSYGYTHETEINAPLQPNGTTPVKMTFQSNFLRPHTQDDQLKDQTQIFDLGKTYPSGTVTPGLAALYKARSIGQGGTAPVNPDIPAMTDPAWQSYRLKGTQTQYYTNDGYPTIVGASITEGGFVNTASCLSCHVQAGVGPSGASPGTSVGGTGRLNLSGIGTVVNGAPYTGDYYTRGTTNLLNARTDFVWGVLFAK